jgi:hypothetical protein
LEDAAWEEIERNLREANAAELIEHVPRRLVEEVIANDSDHPLARLFLEPELPSAWLTSKAIANIKGWLGSERGKSSRPWWTARLKFLTGDSAAGYLAEIRALGVALPSSSTIGDGLKIAPYSAEGRASEFRIEDDTGEVFLEVCCARMNEDEADRVEWIESVEPLMTARAHDAAIEALGIEPGARANATATIERASEGAPQRHQVSTSAMRRPDGGHFVISTVVKAVRPYGEPRTEGEAHTLASRLAGKKPPGQVPAGRAAILWMDLSDPDWAMRVRDTLPVDVFRKGLNLGTTHGIWHSFYGRKGVTPLMRRHAIAFNFAGEMATSQIFNGRFFGDAQRCWSAAVLRCVDGLVTFEHPRPNVLLPMPILRELRDLDGPYASVHRFDEDGDAVTRRLDDIEKMLAFYAA